MHNDNGFKLYVETQNYSRYVRKYILSNISNVYRDLRVHLTDEIYNLERNLVAGQSNKGNIRDKYITEMIINIKMLDLISSDIRDFCPETKKYVDKSIGNLAYIKNMTYRWKLNPEQNETYK